MCCKPCRSTSSRSPVLVYRVALVYVELSWSERSRCAETACTKVAEELSQEGRHTGNTLCVIHPTYALSMQRGRTRPRSPQESGRLDQSLPYMHILVALAPVFQLLVLIARPLRRPPRLSPSSSAPSALWAPGDGEPVDRTAADIAQSYFIYLFIYLFVIFEG